MILYLRQQCPFLKRTLGYSRENYKIEQCEINETIEGVNDNSISWLEETGKTNPLVMEESEAHKDGEKWGHHFQEGYFDIVSNFTHD